MVEIVGAYVLGRPTPFSSITLTRLASVYLECSNIKPYNESIDAPCPDCGGKVIIKYTKTHRPFYVCENNKNTEDSPCHYISWTKPSSK